MVEIFPGGNDARELPTRFVGAGCCGLLLETGFQNDNFPSLRSTIGSDLKVIVSLVQHMSGTPSFSLLSKYCATEARDSFI